MAIRLLHGDCVDRMAQMPEGSLDAIVSDPPYGLEFMGRTWDKLDWQAGGGFSGPGIGDRQTAWPSFGSSSPFGAANPTCASCGGRLRGEKKCSCAEPDWKVKGQPVERNRSGQAQQAWHARWVAEAYRVLQPGGVLKAFGGSRTAHRLAAAMEEVGFIDISLEAWGYGSGFPKSHNVAVYLDRMLTEGKSRQILRHGVGNLNGKFAEAAVGFESQSKRHIIQTEVAKSWEGWGTALKPAWEPVVVGRKPVV